MEPTWKQLEMARAEASARLLDSLQEQAAVLAQDAVRQGFATAEPDSRAAFVELSKGLAGLAQDLAAMAQEERLSAHLASPVTAPPGRGVA